VAFSPNAETVYADGPFGSPLQPAKPEIRTLLAQYEAAIDAYSSGAGSIAKPTRALLFADLAHTADKTAWVYADPTVAFNGIYRKSGASGAGSWSLILPLPFSFIIASDVGAGTANAIQATTSIPLSGSALVWMNIFEANTASPVTVSFNGGSALAIKTNSGEDVEPGGLQAGMIILGVVSGSTFRLFSDQAIAQRLFQARDDAEVAAAAAEAARDIAAGYASDAVSQGNVPIYATVVGMAAINVPPGINALRVNGYYAVGDGGGAFYAKVGSEPAHAGKFQSSDGAWWELTEKRPNSRMFGAKADGATLDTSAVQALVDYSAAFAVPGSLVNGVHLSDTITLASGATLIGSGWDAAIRAKDGVTGGKLLINADAVGGNERIKISGIKIDLNMNGQTGRQDMFQLTKCRKSTISDCLIVDARWPHLVLRQCDGCHVVFNEIRGGIGHGVVLRTGCFQNLVAFNYIHDIGPQDGFDFGDGALRAYGVFLYDGNSTDNTIQGNRIVAPNGHGIYFGGNGTNENYNDNKILDNIVISAGARNIVPTHHGIWISFGLRNLVRGNTVRGSAQDGIKLNEGAHRNIIESNYVYSNGRHGIALDNADSNRIAGNNVFNNSQAVPAAADGIAIGPFGPCLHNEVVGNFCYDTQTIKTQRWGIFETTAPGSDDNTVRDNRVHGNSQNEQLSTRGALTRSRQNDIRDTNGNELETVTITGSQTIQASSRAVLLNVTAPRTVNLPVDFTVTDDYEVLLVDIGGNVATHNVTVVPSSGFTINGTTSFIMNQNNQRTRIVKVPGQKRFVTF
jgi:parallel beta-helix repeat protein